MSDDERHLTDASNQVLLSAAVVWEVAIKRSLGTLDTPGDLGPTPLGRRGASLAVTLDHAAGVEHLPWHHRDPFDRILVARASVEAGAIVSRDEALRAYGIALIWQPAQRGAIPRSQWRAERWRASAARASAARRWLGASPALQGSRRGCGSGASRLGWFAGELMPPKLGPRSRAQVTIA